MVSCQLLLRKKRAADQGKAKAVLSGYLGTISALTVILPDLAPETTRFFPLVKGPGAKGRRLPASESIT